MRWEWVEIAFVIFLVGIFGLIAWACVQMGHEDEALMQECVKDHKEYECTLMIRQSRSVGHAAGVYPVIITK